MATEHDISLPKLARPEIVERMYTQINNISQGFAIAILIDTLAERFMNNSHTFNVSDIVTLLFAVTSLCISIVFWTRYYFDTYIIMRSFSVRSMVWFFSYIVAEGFSFRQINKPDNWLFSTGVFLAFGFGFYILNLSEIKRKRRNNIKLNLPETLIAEETGEPKTKAAIFFRTLYEKIKPEFIKSGTFHSAATLEEIYYRWQWFRLFDLIMLAFLTFGGWAIVLHDSSKIYIASLITFLIAIWQLFRSRDYKKFGFSNH